MAADWSGAATGEERGLWLACADVASGTLSGLGPATRVQAGRDILTAADADPALVVGLDFSFSMPGWWLERCGIASVGQLWADQDRLEGWLAACADPFWGRPGRRRPVAIGGNPLRVTELAAPGRPGSVFQIGGAGAVGTASLRGMPTLAALSAAGLAIWPFDDWALPAVVEAWPRLAIGDLVKSRPSARRAWAHAHAGRLGPVDPDIIAGSADALDAAATALWLCDRAEVPRPPVSDPTIAREGWIDGVALPARHRPLRSFPAP